MISFLEISENLQELIETIGILNDIKTEVKNKLKSIKDVENLYINALKLNIVDPSTMNLLNYLVLYQQKGSNLINHFTQIHEDMCGEIIKITELIKSKGDSSCYKNINEYQINKIPAANNSNDLNNKKSLNPLEDSKININVNNRYIQQNFNKCTIENNSKNEKS